MWCPIVGTSNSRGQFWGVGLAQELTHPVGNCKPCKLSLQFLESEVRCAPKTHWLNHGLEVQGFWIFGLKPIELYMIEVDRLQVGLWRTMYTDTCNKIAPH
jgi:hypothetical protein